MRYSIRTKFFLATGVTVLVFVLTITLFHVIFYEKYALYQNQRQLETTYQSINQELISTGELSASYLLKFESSLGLRILILDQSFTTLYGVTMTADGAVIDTSKYPGQDFIPTIQEYYDEIVQHGYIHATQLDKLSGSQYLYLIGLLANGEYLILRTPLPAIEANIEYSRVFIIASALITLLLSLIMAYIISGRFSKPLVEINTITNRMTHLDFSRKYTGKTKDEIGELGHNINSLSDQLENTINQLQMTNARLEEEIRKERQIDDMRQNLLANVSHDLKTPLAIIQGYAEGLKENISEEKEDRDFYCNVIIEESERMNKLVRQILNLSRLELGKISPEIENIEVCAYINTISERFSLMLQEKQITLKNEVPETIVLADVDMLGQVLVNLIGNAAEHATGHGSIIISGEYRGPKLRVHVYNDGPQLSDDDLDKIWLSFYKVDKARTRAYGGTGLGLTIVKTIIEAHDNECGAENRDGGVSFWFDLTIG